MNRKNPKYFKYSIIIGVIWTFAFLLFMVHYTLDELSSVEEIGISQARELFIKDVSYRKWIAERGGIYVEVNNDFKPNSLLANLPDRDITAKNGKNYTLVNPAYFTRLVHGSDINFGIKSHITSLHPLNKISLPDEWERTALKLLNKEQKEYYSIENVSGEKHLRYIGAMLMERGCLTCHFDTKIGEIRGGITINIPLNQQYDSAYNELFIVLGSTSIYWLVGMTLLFFGTKKFNRLWEVQKEIEQKLVEKEQRLDDFFYNSVEGYCMMLLDKPIDPGLISNIDEVVEESLSSSKIIKNNKTFEKIFGFKESIIGMTEKELASGYEEYARMINRSLFENGRYYLKLNIRNLDGVHVWFEGNFACIYDDKKRITGHFAVLRDITQNVLNEQKINKYAARLEEQVATKNKFISILAHDLKSPYHGFIGVTDILFKNYEKLPAGEVKLMLNELHISLKRQYSLLTKLLTWSRLETGNVEFKPVDFNISEVLDDVILSLSANLRNKNIHISKELSENWEMYADRDLIHMLLRNLISNAIKFSNNGGMIKLIVKNEENYFCFKIKDYGTGISNADQEKLFHLDSHFVKDGTNGETGTGLGLLLCREIIEKHKGIIWIESKEGAGSTFSFAIKKKTLIKS